MGEINGMTMEDFMSNIGGIDDSPFSENKDPEGSPSIPEGKEDSPFADEESVKENKQSTEDIDPNNIFGGDPEGVSSQNSNNEDKGSTTPDNGEEEEEDSSPATSQIYSATLAAMKEEGVLPDLDDEFIKNAKTPEDLAEAISRQVKAQLDQTTRRVDEALENGVEPDQISYYENTLAYLDNLTDSDIEDEGEKGETLRKELIKQDYLSRGFSNERASREAERSIKNGTDIEDAKEALNGIKDYCQKSYDSLIEEAKENTKKQKEVFAKQMEEFKTKALETAEPFSGLRVDKETRQKIYDSVTKPVKKLDDGRVVSQIQLYTMENPTEAQYYFSMFYNMTNGFKDMTKFGKEIAKKETRSALRTLEKVVKGANITSTARSGSVLDFGNDKTPESKFSIADLNFDVGVRK